MDNIVNMQLLAGNTKMNVSVHLAYDEDQLVVAAIVASIFGVKVRVGNYTVFPDWSFRSDSGIDGSFALGLQAKLAAFNNIVKITMEN